MPIIVVGHFGVCQIVSLRHAPIDWTLFAELQDDIPVQRVARMVSDLDQVSATELLHLISVAFDGSKLDENLNLMQCFAWEDIHDPRNFIIEPNICRAVVETLTVLSVHGHHREHDVSVIAEILNFSGSEPLIPWKSDIPWFDTQEIADMLRSLEEAVGVCFFFHKLESHIGFLEQETECHNLTI